LLWSKSGQFHVNYTRICVVAHLGALAHGVVLFARQTTNSPRLVTAELAYLVGVVGRHSDNESVVVRE
jgi:hypothetical protein